MEVKMYREINVSVFYNLVRLKRISLRIKDNIVDTARRKMMLRTVEGWCPDTGKKRDWGCWNKNRNL